jgi:esterase/lipase superfamily enzyme
LRRSPKQRATHASVGPRALNAGCLIVLAALAGCGGQAPVSSSPAPDDPVVTRLTEALAVARARVERLESIVADREAQLEAARERETALGQERDRLRSALDEARGRLAATERELARRSSALERAQAAARERAEEARRAAAESARLAGVVEALESAAERLRADLEAADRESAQLRARLGDQARDADRIAALEANIAALEDTVRDLETALRNADATGAALAEVERERDALRARNDQLTEALDDAREDLRAADEEITRLRGRARDADALRAEVARLEAALIESEARAQRAETDGAAATAEAREARAAAAEATASAQALADAERVLTERLAVMESELASATIEAEAVELEVARLDEALTATGAAQAAAEQEAAQAKERLASAEQTVQEMGSRMEALSRAVREAGARLPAAIATSPPEEVAATSPGVTGAEEAPILRKVYYGTTRARLQRGYLDYARPFLPPFALLAASFLLTRTIRKFVKDRYQRGGTFFSRTVLGIGVVVLTVIAVRDAMQIWDDDHRLLVQYGNDFRPPDADGKAYETGYVEVSIPALRAPGELPLPSLTRFEFVADPTRHFQLASVVPTESRDAFYEDLRTAVGAADGREMFVFVHGFHNTFEDAAFRTEQMAHDTEFPGPPVFFSWPSQGTLLDYLTDAENVDTSILHLQDFLRELHDRSGAQRIHLIAHSMGSRALSNAVAEFEGAYRSSGRFGELVFAAPDIKADRMTQLAGRFLPTVERVTLYASRHDSALVLSRALQGQSASYQRAGETWPTPLVAPPIQTIDVSLVTRGHSYVADSGRILGDMADLITRRRELTGDTAVFVETRGGDGYWVLRKR